MDLFLRAVLLPCFPFLAGAKRESKDETESVPVGLLPGISIESGCGCVEGTRYIAIIIEVGRKVKRKSLCDS